MKTTDTEILICPGFKGSPEDHWQTRWERKLSAARRVHMGDWHKPVFEDWKKNLVSEVARAKKPVVLVGHSLGCQVIVQAAREFTRPVIGAFLVAPPDVENPEIRPRHLLTFGPAPTDPLPFPSIVIASRNDQFCSIETAGDMANAWGSMFIDAGESGHIDAQSGHGPWPEGLMVFSKFMNHLKAPA